MAIHDLNNGTAQVFISNVLNGTIVRLDVAYSFVNAAINVNAATVVGSGFSHRTDPAALVLGPSGLAFDAAHNLLYVASSTDNAIYSLAGAGTTTSSLGSGTLVYQDFTHLHGPLQLVLSPNGHLLVADSDGSNADPNQPSELVEFTTAGQFVGQSPIDPNNGGAFGLAVFNAGWGTVRLAYVDDNANTLTILTTMIQQQLSVGP
jgi:DNA-binding beta-propeller fold protein YncE